MAIENNGVKPPKCPFLLLERVNSEIVLLFTSAKDTS
jgi:hypothetical protein